MGAAIRLGIIVTQFAVFAAAQDQAREDSRPDQVDEYQRTLDALTRYRALAAEDDGELLPATEAPVNPGDQYAGVPRLTRLLRRLGDLPEDAEVDEGGAYEGALVSAVQQFQRRHGLDADGRMDRTTLAQLNTPLSFRVHQLELAADLWRHVPYNASGRAVVLNLPEFRLRALRKGQVELTMKIVVGKAPDRKTPILSSKVEEVIFRPYWNVPLRIQIEEMIPAIVKDPSYLEDHDLEIVDAQGFAATDEVSNGTIEGLRTGSLRLRQRPGPKNSLGLAKFVFPNQYDVYMHDTPVRWVFEKQRRDFSHGCIRVENAEELAKWALQDEPGWTQDRIAATMQGEDSKAVRLRHPVPLVTIYATAVVEEDGEVHFLPDIYEREESLQRQFAAAETEQQ